MPGYKVEVKEKVANVAGTNSSHAKKDDEIHMIEGGHVLLLDPNEACRRKV